MAELHRRVRDIRDETRYGLLSAMGHMLLWYEIHSDCYVMTHPETATWFKRRKHAQLIARDLRPGISIVTARVTTMKSRAGYTKQRVRIVTDGLPAEIAQAIAYNNTRAKRRSRGKPAGQRIEPIETV